MSSIDKEQRETERVLLEVFMRIAAAADDFEGYKHEHAARISRLADEVARLFHMAHHDRHSLRIAALAHDMGEVAMERDYIKRDGPLTEDERLDLYRHPVIGEQEAARSGADRASQLLVRWHHEWWNGAGYPDALSGAEIPLGARILRVCDAYCALTDDRPFRAARTEADARRHLTDWAGIEFDPRVVHAFLSLNQFAELKSHAKKSLESLDSPESLESPTLSSLPTL
ncbi:MAG TPA: HD domain-containing phosphohydrolase [Pyrinomonadaceae bacterium]|jgi:HD-GYP domain-containing protein (c-di-GMP phosphodiesterase class II)